MSSGNVPFSVMNDSMSPAEHRLQPQVAGGLIVLLALGLPFEAPLFSVGPLTVTTVELLLYATLIAWGLQTIPRLVRDPSLALTTVRSFRQDATLRAAGFWCVATLASATTAPVYRAAAFKFALRTWSGVFVFFATRTLARSPSIARGVQRALVAGALLSAASAVVEFFAPSTASLWKVFREEAFRALGVPRPCGVFGYPTIGAMYWEAALPLVVVMPFATWLRKKQTAEVAIATPTPRRLATQTSLCIAGCTLLVGAIFVSATRSALVGSTAACLALLGLGWGSGVRVRRTVVAILTVLGGVWLLALGLAASKTLRGGEARWWPDELLYQAHYAVGQVPDRVRVGESFTVPVTLQNVGTAQWRASGTRPVHLAYHWEPLARAITREDLEGVRTTLPRDVPPGDAVDVVSEVRGPSTSGTYRLRWDLVHEGEAWFSDMGNPTPETVVDALPTSDGVPPPKAEELPPPTFIPPPRAACWRAALLLWRQRPFLGIGPDNFRRRYQEVVARSPSGEPYGDPRIHANSLYLETLCDLGLVGVASLASIVLALIALLRGHTAAGRLAGIASGIGVATFFVHGLVDYFLEFTPLFGLFWILLGLTAAGVQECKARDAPAPGCGVPEDVTSRLTPS